MAWPDADNAAVASSSSTQDVSRLPAPSAARPATAAPSDSAAPGRSAACWRTRSATSRASLMRPDSKRALRCASATLNLMCGASKQRVATVYPVSAMATASAARPASADMAASAQAVSVPTMGGRLSSARFLAASVAASGRSIANQYTVRRASIQLRAWRAVVCDASSMNSFARAGSASAHSMLLARR